MAKRRVEDILCDESFKNKKCDKIKITLGIKDVRAYCSVHLSAQIAFCLSFKLK